MYDPLQAAAANANGTSQPSVLNNAGSPPATPSKSRITARPPPYQRPQPPVTAASPTAASNHQNASNHGHLPSQHLANHFRQAPALTAQSPLGPRPPLPGQVPRPVSPMQLPGQPHSSSSQTFSSGSHMPTSPNAWAASPSTERTSTTAQSRQTLPPGPLPVPSPVGFGSPQRVSSPGVPRSPIADHGSRTYMNASRLDEDDRPTSHSQQQQQPPKGRAPPYVKIRVHGTDRSKKEMGIKMDCITNIPTYHRQHSQAFSRTYAEFHALHGALSANHPESILPALPLPQTSASTEEEEDRFLKLIFQRFMDRLCRDQAVVLDDELRAFVESDFGSQYAPLTRAKKLKAGFLSRSGTKAPTGDDREPDFLVTAKVQSAALELALQEVSKSLEKSIKANMTAATSEAELSSAVVSFATTESHAPLSASLKAFGESIRSVAELEVGQSNAAALVLGDPLAYECVEARSAKDALLQRQYNLDELQPSIKATIAKRRNIEKIRASANIKPERVNEALDELDEAQKAEQALQARVQAISTNLRPSLQTHLRTMNEDILNVLLHHARTQVAYETRKLQVFESVHKRFENMPEKGEADAVYFHPPAASASSATPIAPKAAVSAIPGGEKSRIPSSADPAQTGSVHQSKFLEKEAEIKAHIQAQEEAEAKRHQEVMSRSSSIQSNLGRPAAMTRPPQAGPLSGPGPLAPSSTTGQTGVTSTQPVSQSVFLPASNASKLPSVSQVQANRQPSAPADPLATHTSVPRGVQAVQTPTRSHADPLGSAQGGNSMAQSAFLPGRSANAGRANAGRANPFDDQKRADARKAASLLAGAF